LKRLIDEDLPLESPLGVLAELLRSVPPLVEVPVARRSALLLRIQRAADQSTRGVLRGPPRAPLRQGPRFEAADVGANSLRVRRLVWIVGVAAMLVSAVAAATVARRYAAHSSAWTAGQVAPAAVPVGPLVLLPPPAATPRPSSETVSSLEGAPRVIDEGGASRPPSSVPDVPSARFKLSTNGIHRSPRLGDGEDPTAVLEAIAALRDRGDAARASALLAEHLRAHPRGVLSEDALALAIEAAIARHDTRAAADLGRRYLAQYPNGRYRAFASRATEP